MRQNGILINPPTLPALFQKHKLNIFQTLNCVKVGTIVAFDKDKRTADVQIAFKRALAVPAVDGTLVKSYPKLYGCPVFTLQGGAGALTFPILPGDECLILFSDSNLDAFTENGKAEALPYDARRHDLSDGIVLVGLNSQANALTPAVTSSEVALTYSGAKIAEKNGKITVQNATANLITTTDILLTAMDTYQTAMGVFLAAVASSAVLDAPTKAAASTMAAANTVFQAAAATHKIAMDALLY